MPVIHPVGCRAPRRAGLFLAALALLTITAVIGSNPAGAESQPTAAQLRAEADALSSRYFDALARFQSTQLEIARDEELVAQLSVRAQKARADARARALVAYEAAGTKLQVFVDGTDSLDAARRARLIDHVNARDRSAYARLHAITKDLRQQRQALEATRQAQADALASLRDEGAQIDAKLARAEQQEAAARAAAAAAAAAAAQRSSAPAATSAPAANVAPATATTAAPTTQPPAPSPTPSPPPDYTGTPGVSPHHDDPYLSCVRQRESGGNYSAVNPSGPYLGAYQFLQSTWNVTANHAGRPDLVGVPANRATPYDQDEMAWALYQWQGTAPWGGPCP